MEDYPIGIRYWMQVHLDKVPNFTVYECLGRVFDTDLFWFKERGKIYQFVKTLEELNNDGFRPFLLDMKTLRKKLEAYENS